ncbi:proteasome assembly chaperone 2 [Macrobrachium rosenbergii]|uniref:proteasome assembly chaperone 2 n=1 Tax=Macrobrachium rosenbergii TaxID=79674 RepID=UPI0034D426C2
MIVYPVKESLISNLKGYTLLLPSVSVGNVGQLAVDILISSLPSEKIGLVHHPALYPLVGGDPYNESSKEVTTSADLHLMEQKNLVVMQIRSPLIKKEKNNFITEIVTWCKEVGIRNIVMLASCNAYERRNYSQLTGSQLRYLTTTPEDGEVLRSLGASELEEHEDEFGRKHRFLSGTGFVKHFMEICDLPLTVLFKFVDEGDNTHDAIVLATYFNSWKKVFQEGNMQWKLPFSWRNMFGGPAPSNIY